MGSFWNHRAFGGAAALTLAAACAHGPARGAEPSVRVVTLPDATTLRYPVAFLRGEAAVPAGSELTVVNRSSKRPTREFRTRVHDGRFKALVELVPGANQLQFQAGAAAASLSLTYRPQTNPRRVRMVYFTDSSGDTTYQSERADDPQDYAARLDTAAKLMQTFTGERMHDLGHGRKTFNLELDAAGKVVVHTVRGPQPAAYYHAQTGNELYSEIHRWLNGNLPDPNAKNLAVMAFTRFDPATKTVKAHTALGGGNLGLFGSAGMFVWPRRLQEVQAAFSDETRVDGARTHDDSAFRSTYWGLASTTLGAVLHEMGHTFGLPHTEDPNDIMTRGFDRFNRFFTLVEPPHARRAAPYPFPDAEVPYFSPAGSEKLAVHPYFQPDGTPQ